MNFLLKTTFFSILLASLSVFLLFSTPAHAQVLIGSSPDGVDITSSPDNPSPGKNTTVTVQSTVTDLTRASISWSVNQKLFSKGNGITSIVVPAPAVGKSLQVSATINTVEGASIIKVVTIKSGDIEIILEHDGYVPPLYRGKTAFPYQGTLTAIAVPHFLDVHGKPIDPKDVTYTWKKDYLVLGDSSGYGKQTLTLTGSVIARDFIIYVDALSRDGSSHGQAQFTVSAQAPSLLLYQDDPLYGMLYNKAVGDNFRLAHNEARLTVVPYSFSIPHGDFATSSLQYQWTVDGTLHDELSSSPSIVLRSNGQEGSSNISLALRNIADNILQSAQTSFTALYNGNNTTSSNNASF